MRHRTTWKDIVVALLSGIGSALFVFLLGGGLVIVLWSMGMGNFGGWPFTKVETIMFLVILGIASFSVGVITFRKVYRAKPYQRFLRRNGHRPLNL